ncbi:MAG: LD-carboxypeptidase [Verrucomicrobia bacterium]|nr:MAG: LD-carboxypeptidase [Verrucomicrobiota bacterium]
MPRSCTVPVSRCTLHFKLEPDGLRRHKGAVPIKPERLCYGDTIGIIAPASAPPDPKAIDRSVEVLQRMGFKTKLAPNVRKRWGFLAGSDRDRAADLMGMFRDRKVQAIICVRGGYGAARLLPLLDYEVIRRNPKIFVGYSDITSLHIAFLKKANLISFHGPMLNSDFIKENCPEFTVQSFLRTLMEPEPAGSICGASPKSKVQSPKPGQVQSSTPINREQEFKVQSSRFKIQVLRDGVASGQLVGGNITLLCTTLGTAYQMSFRDKILFFEDLDEKPYGFDRMLTHLLNSGVMRGVAGIAIGINKGCKDPKATKAKEYRQTLEDVFRERLLRLKVPVVMGLPFGHIRHNATLPVGARVTLDAEKGNLVIAEAAVK